MWPAFKHAPLTEPPTTPGWPPYAPRLQRKVFLNRSDSVLRDLEQVSQPGLTHTFGFTQRLKVETQVLRKIPYLAHITSLGQNHYQVIDINYHLIVIFASYHSKVIFTGPVRGPNPAATKGVISQRATWPLLEALQIGRWPTPGYTLRCAARRAATHQYCAADNPLPSHWAYVP